MRKAFNFYKSYFDVYMELSDKDKVKFMDALLKRQFYGIEPVLEGISKFAYISQRHNIDSQIKGWEDKTKCKLSQHPTEPPCQPPSGQEKEKEKEKEKEEGQLNFDFLKLFNEITKRKFKILDSKAKNQLKVRLKEGFTEDDFRKAIDNCMKDEYHIENPKYLTPEFITRPDKLQKYLNSNGIKSTRNPIISSPLIT